MQTITMPDGTTQQVPRYTQTTSLSPEQQQLYNLNTQTQQNIGQIGVDQSRRIGDLLGKPVDLSGLTIDPNSFSQDRQRVEQSLRDRMAGQNEQQYNQLENRLTNQGFQRGTQAFTDAIGEYQRGINDQNLAIIGQGRAEQQGMYGMASDAAQREMTRRLTERNTPINEISALMSGSQVSMPNTPGYNPGQVAGTDVSGSVYNSAALANDQYKQQEAARRQQMAGLYGLAGTGAQAAMWFSDRRLKRDIRDLGIKLMNGLKLYAYKYLWSDEPQIGVMAQEVLKVRPQAVHMVGGYMAVDYGKLL